MSSASHCSRWSRHTHPTEEPRTQVTAWQESPEDLAINRPLRGRAKLGGRRVACLTCPDGERRWRLLNGKAMFGTVSYQDLMGI
jgi:hypothetical protein